MTGPESARRIYPEGSKLHQWIAPDGWELRSFAWPAATDSPRGSILFQGGRGAWELVGRFSYSDMDDGAITGGKFWRFTPMVNWHMSDNVRLELVYGYGSLDRFAATGKTQFFQSRIQLQL